MILEELSVDEVELDMQNPRIARAMEMYDPDQITGVQISMALGCPFH